VGEFRNWHRHKYFRRKYNHILSPRRTAVTADRRGSRGKRREPSVSGQATITLTRHGCADADADKRQQRCRSSSNFYGFNFRLSKYKRDLASRGNSRRQYNGWTNLRRRVKSVPGGDHSARRKRGISRAARGAVPESSNADRREPDNPAQSMSAQNNNPVRISLSVFRRLARTLHPQQLKPSRQMFLARGSVRHLECDRKRRAAAWLACGAITSSGVTLRRFPRPRQTRSTLSLPVLRILRGPELRV